MLKKILFFLCIMSIFVSSDNKFHTGCRKAEGANFTSETYSFIIMDGVVFCNVSPINGAANIDVMRPIEFDVLHSLPIQNVSVEVFCNGNPVSPASISLTPIAGGFHVVFTPANPYSVLSNITWRATAIVDGE